MRAKAIYTTENATQPWMLSVAVLFVVTANTCAWGEANSSHPETKAAAIKNTKPFGKLPLVLSMTLSLRGNEPTRPDNSTKIAEVLQQDSIAKEKMLGDLNAQIVAMEQLIKAQQSQLEISANAANSHVASAEMLAQSAAVVSMSGVSSVSGIGNAQPQPEIVAPAVRPATKEENSRVELLQMHWLKPAIGLGLALLAVLGLVWYRRYNIQVRQSPANAQTALPMVERTLKIPVSRKKKSLGDLDMTGLRK